MYEIDTKTETAETQLDNRNVSGINKQGYLMKGPEVGIDRVFANISSKYFKRRYCVLEQQIDGTFILELFKDHQKGDAKMTIVMDFCTEICKVSFFFKIFQLFKIQQLFNFNLECYINIFFKYLEYQKRKMLFRVENVGWTQIVYVCSRK